MLFSSSPVLYHLHSYSLCPFFIFSYSLPFYFSLFFYFFFSLFFSSLFLLHSLFLGYFPLLLFIKSLLSAILVYFFHIPPILFLILRVLSVCFSPHLLPCSQPFILLLASHALISSPSCLLPSHFSHLLPPPLPDPALQSGKL